MLWRVVTRVHCVAGWGGDPGGWAGTAGQSGRGGLLRKRAVCGGTARVAVVLYPVWWVWHVAAGRGGLAVTVGA